MDLPDTESYKQQVVELIHDVLLDEFPVQKQPGAKPVMADFKVQETDPNWHSV
jgi:hypothetical protein